MYSSHAQFELPHGIFVLENINDKIVFGLMASHHAFVFKNSLIVIRKITVDI